MECYAYIIQSFSLFTGIISFQRGGSLRQPLLPRRREHLDLHRLVERRRRHVQSLQILAGRMKDIKRCRNLVTLHVFKTRKHWHQEGFFSIF